MGGMPWIDTHAHVSEEPFEEACATVQRALDAGVNRIINICTNQETLSNGHRLAQHFPGVFFNTGATTPHDLELLGDEDFITFEHAALRGQLVAIGETGLDTPTSPSQRDFLIRYAQLAAKLCLPLVIHCRNAFEELFSLLQSHKGTVILHCFTGTDEEVEEAVGRGWFISISGIVTFSNAKELRETCKGIPLPHLLLETDAPYLSPHPYRGKRNEPSRIPLIGKCIAQCLDMEEEKVAHQIYSNSLRAFDLPH